MASISGVREALRAQLDAHTSLHAYAYVVGQVPTPAAVVAPNTGDFLTYDAAFGRGIDDMQFVITVLAARVDDPSAQATLDSYLDSESAGSVKAAVEADPTLGGVVDTASVAGARNYGTINYAGVEYVACEVLVEVAA